MEVVWTKEAAKLQIFFFLFHKLFFLIIATLVISSTWILWDARLKSHCWQFVIRGRKEGRQQMREAVIFRGGN